MGVDYYNILCLTRSATDAEIKKLYRKLSLKYHPDKNPGDQNAADKFMQVAEAFDVLSDPRKRAVYDQFGEEGLKRGVPAGSGEAGAWTYGYTFHGNPEKVFRDFFGGDNPFQGKDIINFPFSSLWRMALPVQLIPLQEACTRTFIVQLHLVVMVSETIFVHDEGAKFYDRVDGDLSMGFGGLYGRGTKKQDPPIERDLYLSLEEVYHGCTKKMKISRRVMNEDGHTSSIRDKILTIDVKKGWRPGTRITFPKEGDQGPNNIPADIVFVVKDKPHPRFRREGANLIHTAKVPLGRALTGCTISIHTLDEKVLHIPITDIVRPGYRKVVPGEGLPLVVAPCDKGDIIIEFDIEFPKSLNPEKKEHIRKALLV